MFLIFNLVWPFPVFISDRFSWKFLSTFSVAIWVVSYFSYAIKYAAEQYLSGQLVYNKIIGRAHNNNTFITSEGLLKMLFDYKQDKTNHCYLTIVTHIKLLLSFPQTREVLLSQITHCVSTSCDDEMRVSVTDSGSDKMIFS